jgi:CRP-like cAMP-binding protein
VEIELPGMTLSLWPAGVGATYPSSIEIETIGGRMAKTRNDSGIVQLIKTVPLFASCSPKELKAIAATAKLVDFEPGAEICKEGTTGVGMHVIMTGETKVMVGGRTRRRLGPGAFFGEIALLDQGPRSATVVADSPVETLVISSWAFRGLLKRQPNLSLKLLEEVSRRLRTAGTSVTN